MFRDRIWIVIVLLALLTAAAWIFRDRLPAISPGEWQGVLYFSMAALLVGGGMLARGGDRMGPHWLRNAAFWIVIFAAATLLVGVFAPGLSTP